MTDPYKPAISLEQMQNEVIRNGEELIVLCPKPPFGPKEILYARANANGWHVQSVWKAGTGEMK